MIITKQLFIVLYNGLSKGTCFALKTSFENDYMRPFLPFTEVKDNICGKRCAINCIPSPIFELFNPLTNYNS